MTTSGCSSTASTLPVMVSEWLFRQCALLTMLTEVLGYCIYSSWSCVIVYFSVTNSIAKIFLSVSDKVRTFFNCILPHNFDMLVIHVYTNQWKTVLNNLSVPNHIQMSWNLIAIETLSILLEPILQCNLYFNPWGTQ